MNQTTPPLYRFPGPMYAAESPVVISSGELLADPQNNRFLVRLVFENLTDKVITAVKVRIASLDPADRPTGDALEFYYLDLFVPRGSQFGADRCLPLTHPATRGFSYKLLEVIFADKTVWSGGNAVWEPLPARIPLEEALDDKELVKQYRLRYGQNCRYVPLVLGDLYICSCGTVNLGHENCRVCTLAPTLLSTELLDSLRSDANIRLEREAAQQAEQARLLAIQQEEQRKLQEEQQRQAEEQRKLLEEENSRKAEARRLINAERGEKLKKTGKKILKATIWTAASLVLALVLYVVSVLWIVPEVRYQNALKALDKEDYQEAHRLFMLMQDYKDSQDYLSRFRVVTVSSKYTWDVSDLDVDAEGHWPEDSFGQTTEYTRDPYGNTVRTRRVDLVLKNGKFVPEGDPVINEDFTAYQYSANGKPLKVTSPNGTYTVYSYSGEGLLTRQEEFRTDGTAAGTYTTYTYNGSGFLTESAEVTPTKTTTYSYSYSSGKLTQQVQNVAIHDNLAYADTSEAIISYVTTFTYEYDRRGNLTEIKTRTEYPDDSGNNSRTTTKYEYDLSGRLLLVEYETDGYEEKISFAYNWRGDITEYKTSSSRLDGEGELLWKQTEAYTVSYNPLGHMKQIKGSYSYSTKDYEQKARYTSEVKCRINGSLQQVTTTSRSDSPNENYTQTIFFDENQQSTYSETVYESGIVREQEYEYAYYYLPDPIPSPAPEPFRNPFQYFQF